MSELTGSDFVELQARHGSEFRRHIGRQLWNRSDAEDVLADGIAAAWQNRGGFQAGTNFRAWMYRILTNKCYVANRHTMRFSHDPAAVPEVRAFAATRTVSDGRRQPGWLARHVSDEVYGAVMSLRPAEQACLLLRGLDGCSYRHIARILRIPHGTVMTHLARGRARARSALRSTIAEQSGPASGGVAPAPQQKRHEGDRP